MVVNEPAVPFGEFAEWNALGAIGWKFAGLFLFENKPYEYPAGVQDFHCYELALGNEGSPTQKSCRAFFYLL